MKTIYSIKKSALVLDDGNFILTYGIEASDENSGNIISDFKDVSVNKKLTEHIVSILNSCEVEVCHFHDVVIDELNR
ncbi:MAG: DUF6514 family protein [Acutalibacteraceae bacterium]|nr:DUF6514 family protein [Acutalibacteraceae bacterium]